MFNYKKEIAFVTISKFYVWQFIYSIPSISSYIKSLIFNKTSITTIVNYVCSLISCIWMFSIWICNYIFYKYVCTISTRLNKKLKIFHIYWDDRYSTQLLSKYTLFNFKNMSIILYSLLKIMLKMKLYTNAVKTL